MANVKNVAVHDDDEMEMIETGLPTQEEVLMSEDDLIAGLLEAADFKTSEALQKKIQIKRRDNNGNDKVFFEFRIHPLDEEETQEMRRKCTKYAPNPNGRNLPKIEVSTDYVRMRSMKIFNATVPEDQEKVWNNKKIKEKLKVLDPLEVIELVLMAGEKDAIVDQIDAISGYGVTLEDYVKN